MSALEKFHVLTNGDSPGITADQAVKECEQMASVSNNLNAMEWYKLALQIEREKFVNV